MNIPLVIPYLESHLARDLDLKIKWFDRWTDQLTEAAKALPQVGQFPMDLYAQLLRNPTPEKKIIALLTEAGTPVSIVGLRAFHSYWEPVTTWIVPGVFCHAAQADVLRSLKRTGVEIRVGWWRTGAPLPQGPTVHLLEQVETYQMDLTSDIEQYWRANGQYKNLRRDRNRCTPFECRKDAPGDAEWTIRNWERKWRGQPEVETPGLSDRLFVCRYLEGIHKYHTISILDHERIVGAASFIEDGKDAVAMVCYRDPDYEWYGIGNRLIHLCIEYAQELGLERFDYGGGQEYKKHWAPVGGVRYTFKLVPPILYYPKQLVRTILRK